MEAEFDARDKVAEVEETVAKVYKRKRARSAVVTSKVSTRKKMTTREDSEYAPSTGPMTRARKNMTTKSPGKYMFLNLIIGFAW